MAKNKVDEIWEVDQVKPGGMISRIDKNINLKNISLQDIRLTEF